MTPPRRAQAWVEGGAAGTSPGSSSDESESSSNDDDSDAADWLLRTSVRSSKGRSGDGRRGLSGGDAAGARRRPRRAAPLAVVEASPLLLPGAGTGAVSGDSGSEGGSDGGGGGGNGDHGGMGRRGDAADTLSIEYGLSAPSGPAPQLRLGDPVLTPAAPAPAGASDAFTFGGGGTSVVLALL